MMRCFARKVDAGGCSDYLVRLVPTWHYSTGMYEHVGAQPVSMYISRAGRDVLRVLLGRNS